MVVVEVVDSRLPELPVALLTRHVHDVQLESLGEWRLDLLDPKPYCGLNVEHVLLVPRVVLVLRVRSKSLDGPCKRGLAAVIQPDDKQGGLGFLDPQAHQEPAPQAAHPGR